MKSDNFLLLALAAQKFGCRPSTMAVIRDPVLALDFDLAAATRLLLAERRMHEGIDEPISEVYW